MAKTVREPSRDNITQLLEAWNAGDADAAMEAMPLVYDELREIAHRYFRRERSDHTLQATAVVHEAYMRLVEETGVRWQSRSHFVGTVAHMMRRILVDYAREHAASKRGGDAQKVTLMEARVVAEDRPPDLVRLDETLDELAQIDPQKAEIVELRFFGGLTIDETAQFLGISTATVIRQWRRARAWLFGQLHNAAAGNAAVASVT